MKVYLPCQGGLGNQLFIWAAAHKIASDLKCTVNITYLNKDKAVKDRELFPLKEFCNHNISVSNSIILGKILIYFDVLNHQISKFVNRSLFKSFLSDFNNPHIAPAKWKSKTLIIRGYFQNNNLVNSVSELIIPELNLMLIAQKKIIEMNDYIAIHVRRGDYLESPNFYGILTKRYYDKILSNNKKYVLFTEIKDQVKDFQNDKNVITIIDQQKATVWETLALLADSKTLHMANSTLSWWGAKLSENNNKVITMPFPWNKQGYDFQNLLVSEKFILIKSEFEKNVN